MLPLLFPCILSMRTFPTLDRLFPGLNRLFSLSACIKCFRKAKFPSDPRSHLLFLFVLQWNFHKSMLDMVVQSCGNLYFVKEVVQSKKAVADLTYSNASFPQIDTAQLFWCKQWAYWTQSFSEPVSSMTHLGMSSGGSSRKLRRVRHRCAKAPPPSLNNVNPTTATIPVRYASLHPPIPTYCKYTASQIHTHILQVVLQRIGKEVLYWWCGLGAV